MNGERITEVVVGAGDVIEIGGARITILEVDDGAATSDPIAPHRSHASAIGADGR